MASKPVKRRSYTTEDIEPPPPYKFVALLAAMEWLASQDLDPPEAKRLQAWCRRHG